MTRRANELDDDGGGKTWLVETALSPLDVFILQNLLFAEEQLNAYAYHPTRKILLGINEKSHYYVLRLNLEQS